MAEPVPSVAPQTTTIDQPQPVFQQPYKPICNPCPCTTLQCGVQIIALVEMIFEAQNAVGLFAGIAMGVLNSQMHKEILPYLIIGFFIVLGLFILAFILYLGASKRSRWKCCVYFIGRSILQIILFILLIVFVSIQASRKTLTLGDYVVIAGFCIIIFIGMYVLFVVYVFMEQVKYHPNRPDLYLAPYQPQPEVVLPLSYNDGVAST